jgi:hypothetical protein
MMPEISIRSIRKAIYYLAYILPPGFPREKSEGLILLRPFEWLSVCLTIDSACSLMFCLVKALSNFVGIIVEGVQNAFPDALGWRLVEDPYYPVEIEFKFRSSGYRDTYFKDKLMCDILVCW